MGNVVVTTLCNRDCPYCFANGKGVPRDRAAGGGTPAHMSIENLDKVIEFFGRSGLTMMGVMGGEPTLHPEFPLVIGRVLDAGLDVRLFTGGLVSERAIACLKATDPGRVGILVNVPAPQDCRSEEYRRVEHTVRELADRSALGFTIADPGVDLEFLVEMAVENGTRPFIRLSIALSRMDAERSFLEPGRWGEAARQVLHLAEACDRDDIGLRFDCGFAFCMFTPEELGRLRAWNCEAVFVCSPIVDIGPDLNVWSCFPLRPMAEVRLEDFATRDEVVECFLRAQRAYRTFGVRDECHVCKHKRRGQCAGGCLADVVREFARHGGPRAGCHHEA